MQIEELSSGDVMALCLKGKLTIGQGDELLPDRIKNLIQTLNLNKRIEGLLSTTKLLRVFDTYKTEQEALDSF